MEADPSLPIVRRIIVGFIRVYQRFSRLKPRVCRFQPTCSEYAAQAILKFGVVKGIGLGVWRILRCNPFCEGGDDPVPK